MRIGFSGFAAVTAAAVPAAFARCRGRVEKDLGGFNG